MKSPSKSTLFDKQYSIIKKFRTLFILILFAGLVSTMSRGVIAAVLISTGALIILHISQNIKKFRTKSIVQISLVIVVLIILVYAFGDNVLQKINVNTGLLTQRLSSDELEGGTASRFAIWNAGISAMNEIEIVFGHGMSSFRMLANSNGYDYYSHSVFVDTLATTGILGFLVLLIMYMSLFLKIIKSKNVASLSFLLYSIVNYLTHGNMVSLGFWISLSISYALCINIKQDDLTPSS